MAIKAVRVSRERGSEKAAVRFKAKERGMAKRVPMVPGNHGKYPAPAPVTKNRINLCSLGMWDSSQLCQDELLGPFEKPV